MKLTVSLLLLALMSQTFAAKKSTKNKKTVKSEKSGIEESNYGEGTEPRGHHSREEDNDTGEDLSYRPHIYSPHHYGKISDVLAEGHYHDAIAHQLYSPLSPYQHRFGVPGYEISAPIPSELAYSAHEIHRPISSKKYKKKGQSKHFYPEEDLAKELHYPHTYPHFPSYPHDYSPLGHLYPHAHHQLYPERALISPHLYHGVSPLVRPIVPPVLGHHVIPQVGLAHPLAYANGAIPYAHGYVQPVQYIQQHSVEQVIPGVPYGQENQGQEQESQRDVNGQVAQSGVVGQQVALQQLQQQQQQQIQPQQIQTQQFQQQPIPTQQLQPQQYQQQLLIQPQQLQPQQLQPQNVQLQLEQTQGAVSYASFTQNLPSNYQQNQAYGPPQTQPTQKITSQFSQRQIYQPQSQIQTDSRGLFQTESSTQKSQQELPKLQSLRNFQATPSPQPTITVHTIAPGYLPAEDKQELNEEASQSLIQIQTTEPPHLQSFKQLSGIQQTTIRPEPTAQPITRSQPTQPPSQFNYQPQQTTTTSPQPKQQHSSNDLSSTDQDEFLQELTDDQPTIYSQEVVIQQPGVPGADIQYFGDYTGSLLRNYHQNS